MVGVCVEKVCEALDVMLVQKERMDKPQNAIRAASALTTGAQ